MHPVASAGVEGELLPVGTATGSPASTVELESERDAESFDECAAAARELDACEPDEVELGEAVRVVVLGSLVDGDEVLLTPGTVPVILPVDGAPCDVPAWLFPEP